MHTFTAPDPEGATTIWTLDGADKDEFTIAGGVLRFDDHPNFESPTDSGSNNLYNIVIKAADRANNDPNIGEFRVNVRVTDVNEDPQFDAETATIEVAENRQPTGMSPTASSRPPTRTATPASPTNLAVLMRPLSA